MCKSPGDTVQHARLFAMEECSTLPRTLSSIATARCPFPAAISYTAEAFSLLSSLNATFAYHALMTVPIAPAIPTTNPITTLVVLLPEPDGEVGDEEEFAGDRPSVTLDNEHEVAGAVAIKGTSLANVPVGHVDTWTAWYVDEYLRSTSQD